MLPPLNENSVISYFSPFFRKESTDSTTALETRPTVRKFDPVARENLTDFGQYVAECMPKFVQKVQITAGDELEILIAPSGVVPVLSFLKNHHNAQASDLNGFLGISTSLYYYYIFGYSLCLINIER